LQEKNKINLQKLFSRKDNQFIITNCLIIILSNILNLITVLSLTTIRTINLRNFFLSLDTRQYVTKKQLYNILSLIVL